MKPLQKALLAAGVALCIAALATGIGLAAFAGIGLMAAALAA